MNTPANPETDLSTPLIRTAPRDRMFERVTRRVIPAEVETILDYALTGDIDAQAQLFSVMEDTWPKLSKNLHELKSAVAAVGFEVIPYAEDDKEATPTAKDKAEIVERALWGMKPKRERLERGFRDTIFDLMDAYAKGHSVIEIMWENRKGLNLPRATRFVPSRYYGYPMSGDGEDRLMLIPSGRGYASANSSPSIEFPPHKFLIGIYGYRSGHPATAAMVRTISNLWAMRTFSQKWLASYAEIFGQPMRWATYDPNNAHLANQIATMLENMGSAGWAAFPQGTTLELKQPAGSTADNPQAYIIELADRACDMLILGQTLTSDVGSSGSRALGDVHQSVRLEYIEKAADWVATMLTEQLAPSVVELNYGEAEEIPTIIHQCKRPKDEKAMAERDQILFGSLGLPVDSEYLYERYGVPPPSGKEDALFSPKSSAPASLPQANKQNAPKPAQTDEEDTNEDGPMAAARARRRVRVVADRIGEHVTGIGASFLGRSRVPLLELARSVAAGKSPTESELATTLEACRSTMPEAFAGVTVESLADAIVESFE